MKKIKLWRLFNMKKINYLSLIIIMAFFFAVPHSLLAKYKGNGTGKNKKPRLAKVAVNPGQSLIDINNITTWVSQEGFHDWVVASSWNGAFPNGTAAGAIFSEGIVWGGKVNDGSSPTVRVNGNTYGTGCKAITRLYRVRPDYLKGNLTQDAADFLNKSIGSVTSGDIQQLRDQYAKDWNEWPAKQGAPWYVDSVRALRTDGAYDPNNPHDIPGIPNASQTLFIMYSDANSASLYSSPPIGLQVSETYWAYSYSGALGNVIYKKVDMVYKGTATSASNSEIDSMYIVQWADPDVGNSTDDFAGCDTSLGLGYAYNSGATDAVYQGLGLAPPAVGYDFLQGASKYTGNPSDSAIFNLKWRHGYKYINPKPMSSYAYFAAGGTWGDPTFDYNGTLEFYNLMRGYLPIPQYPSAKAFPTSVADVTPFGTYLLDGNPVDGTGKIDGSVDGPGDRRIMVTNGPITMQLGDTAQVVLALVGGLGSGYLNSVATMKQNDDVAQKVYDLLFKLPVINPPDVHISQLNKKIVLTWPDDKKIENFSDQKYNFEGYEIYQLPTSSSGLSDGVLLATYDKVDGVTTIYDTTTDANGKLVPVLVVNGKDNGIRRFFEVTTDPFRHTDLRNGQDYYFAVVSYAYNPLPLLPFHALRSAFVVRTATPQIPLGERFGGTTGDTLTVKHTTGKSDGEVVPIVVDPSATTGDNYKVAFDTSGGGYVWNLIDVTTGKTLAANQTNQSGNDNYPIVGGMLVKVLGPPIAINSLSYTGTRWVSGVNWGGAQFFGGMDLGQNFWGDPFPAAGYVPVEMKWTGGSGKETPSVANGWAQGATYRRDKGYAYGGIGWMPFQTFDISDPANPVQLNVCFVEDSVNGSANLKWDMGWNGTDFAADGGREYTFINSTPYDPNHYNGTNVGLDNENMYDFWPGVRTSAAAHPYLQAPFTMTIVPNYPNIETDAFTFTAPTVDKSTALEKTDVNKINVFPNPYYGYQYRETSRDDHYVTFSHLPGTNVTIRIFDLSGVLVKTINHINGKQFETWNLQNDSGYPVASGIYVAYIDMPGLGTTKVLKLAIVQEQQILKVY
jgi:hypothetical protein